MKNYNFVIVNLFQQENEDEYDMSIGSVITPEVHMQPEVEHRPVPVEHLASKDCLVCGRAYRYSHNARRHELTSHGYDRYTNKIEPNAVLNNSRTNNHNSKARFSQNALNNRMGPGLGLVQSHSGMEMQSQSAEPEILKSLLTARQNEALSESENIHSRSESPESDVSDSELQQYQVEAIISEPDTYVHNSEAYMRNSDAYMHNSDSSDDEKDVQMGQSPRSNTDVDYDVDLELTSQLDINKIIGVDGDDYEEEYNDANDENLEYDEEVQNVTENVESEVVCSADAESNNVEMEHENDNQLQEEQEDDVPVSLVPIVELNENANMNNVGSEDSESEDESPVSNQSAILNNVHDNNFTISSSQRDFIAQFRDVIEQINTMRCKCCDKEFPRRKAVIQHLQKNGSRIPKHTCYSCILSFNNIGAFLSHMRYNSCSDTWKLIYQDEIPESMVVDEYPLMDSQDSSEGVFKSQYKDVLNYRSYACKICSAKHQLKQFIMKHVLDVHESVTRSLPLTCFNCKYKFTTSRLLKKHIQNGECTVNVACELCSARFNSTQDFNEHVLIMHMEAFANQSFESNGRSTYCTICKNSFSNYHNLVKHMRIVHNEGQVHSCQHCDAKFMDIGDLNQHVYHEHTEQLNGHEEETEMKEEITTYNYSCTDCDAVFETVDGWTDHQIIVHHHVAYACNQCNKKFWDENELEEHKMTHMKMQPYRCMLCPSSFGSTQKLSEHVTQFHQETAMHDKSYESQFYCGICIRSFKSRQAFSNHMRIHAKIPTTNRRAGEVKRSDTQPKPHQVHTQVPQSSAKPLKIVNPAPHSCDICGKGFLHKKNIWKHKKILHSNIVNNKSKENSENIQAKSISTEEEDYTNDGHSRLSIPQFDSFIPLGYDQLDNSGSEGNLTYQCDLCDKKFAVKSSIWKHKRVKHGVINPMTPEATRIEPIKQEIIKTELNKTEVARTSCTICKINFTDKKAYYRHRKIAHKASIQVCKICGITLNTSIELFEHLQSSHAKELLGYNASQGKPQKKVQISRPNLSSDEEEVGQMLSHSSNRKVPKYSCETCGKGFNDVIALQNHNCAHRGSKSETYDCEICNKSYTSISALKSHRGWHLRSPDGRAAFSNSGLWMPQNKVTNKVSKHEVLETMRAKNQFSQKEISPLQIKRKLPPDVQVTVLKKKKFSNDNSMEQSSIGSNDVQLPPVNHQINPVNDDRYCEPCNKVFTKKAAYQRHMDEVHKPNTVFCPICAKSFTRKSTLLQHMQKHDTGDISEALDGDDSDDDQEMSRPEPRPPPMYRCEVCSLQYSSSKALRRHRLKHHRDADKMSQHTNEGVAQRLPESSERVEKEYKCSMCEEDFETEEEAYNHSHYSCSICRMYFSQNQYLVEHMQTHHSTNEQMYFPCDKCERFYMNKKSLQRHIESFH